MGEPRVVCEGDTCFVLQEGQLGLLQVYDLGKDYVVVEWDKTGYSKFHVQIKEPGSEEWRTLSESLSGPMMRKKNLVPGEKYDFRARGWIEASQSWSDWSPIRSVVTLSESADSSKLACPVVIGNEVMPDGEKSVMTVQWPDAPTEGAVYQVQYRRMNEAGDWLQVSTELKGTMMRKKNIEPGEQWTFRVRWGVPADDTGEVPEDSWSEWSVPSEPVSTKALDNAFVSLFGSGANTLKDSSGTFVDTRSLAGKVVCLYFSAHWCPPCRQFTPQLASVYTQLRAQGRPVEVVFVSADRDVDSFKEYAGSMPWLSVDYDSPQRNKIMQHYQVNGIPNLKVFSPNGSVLSDNAVGGMSYSMMENFVKQCGL